MERIDFRAIKAFTACLYDTPPKVWMRYTYTGEPGKEPRITDGDYRVLKYLCKNSNFKYREDCFGYKTSILGLAKQLCKERKIIRPRLKRLIKSGAVEMLSEGKQSFFRVKHFENTPELVQDIKTRLKEFGLRYKGYF